jgi:hypothetical protein
VDVATGKETGNTLDSKLLRSSAMLTSLAVLATTGAFAGSQPVPPSDEVARDLQSLNVTVSDLSVPSDAASNRQAAALNDLGDVAASPMESSNSGEDSAAPILYLTPRVTTLLDTVFDNTSRAPLAPQEVSQDGSQDSTNTPANALQKSAPVTVTEKDSVVPQFQRHMYRNDI